MIELWTEESDKLLNEIFIGENLAISSYRLDISWTTSDILGEKNVNNFNLSTRIESVMV